MKISRICVLVLLVVVGAAVAFGTSVNDPKIIIRGVSGNSPISLTHCPEQGCTKVGMNFNFSSPQSGKGTLFFTNNSGQNWTSLTLIEHGHQVLATDISCQSNLFMSCTTKALGNGNVAIVLSGIKGNNPQKGLGILSGQNFSITFACVGKSCWPGGLDFSAHANATIPEPGTIALMVTGLGALVSRRKMWKNRFHA
jgi:hypothetical protein